MTLRRPDSKDPTRLHPESGSMLLIAMNVVVILSAMAAAFLIVAFGDSQEHRSANGQMKAFYIAEAGLSAALADVRVGGTGILGTAENRVAFNYGSYFTQAALDGDLITVVSIGAYNRERLAIEGVIDRSPVGESFFTSAAGGEASVQILDNATTDSYDSSAGTYLSQQNSDYLGFSVADSEGSVESNGTIDVGAGAAVYGNAETDPNGTLNGQAAVFGTTSLAIVKRKYLQVIKPGLDQSYLGNVVWNSGTWNAPSAIYGANQVDLAGNAQVTITGPATMVIGTLRMRGSAKLYVDDTAGPVYFYVIGGMYLDGTAVEIRSLSSSPKSVFIFSELDNYTGFENTRTGDPTRPLSTNTNAEVHGVIYVPNGTVNVSDTSEVFGSVYGKKVVLDGSGAIHFDSTLGSIPTLPVGDGVVATAWTTGPGGFGDPGGELITWRRVSPLTLISGGGGGEAGGGGEGEPHQPGGK